jgi:carboxymethylenebutenolidase
LRQIREPFTKLGHYLGSLTPIREYNGVRIFAPGESAMRVKPQILVACILCLLSAANVSATVRTRTVRYRSGNEVVSAYLAEPGTPGKHPALIVIHEWWGLVPWVKQQTRKFADAGFVALAVDLYRGQTATTPAAARKLVMSLPPERAMSDLQAAFAYLASQRNVEPAKIGVVGWCFGGGWALRLAVHQPRLAACAVNYGELPTNPEQIQAIRCPVLGNFGALDPGITPAKVRAFEAAMKQAGKSINAKIYPGASHAFENPNNKTGYRPEAAENAWRRMVAFFDRTLK